MLSIEEEYQKAIDKPLQDKSLQCIAGFQYSKKSYCNMIIPAVLLDHFALYIPKVHKEYQDTLQTVYKRHKKNCDVKCLFCNSIYSTAICNFGSKTIIVFHKDYKNKVNGFLAIISFRKFKHTKDSHLVLKDLKLIIEFSSESTILFLSCIIEYVITPIRNDKCRYSFVQYTARGPFQ